MDIPINWSSVCLAAVLWQDLHHTATLPGLALEESARKLAEQKFRNSESSCLTDDLVQNQQYQEYQENQKAQAQDAHALAEMVPLRWICLDSQDQPDWTFELLFWSSVAIHLTKGATSDNPKVAHLMSDFAKQTCKMILLGIINNCYEAVVSSVGKNWWPMILTQRRSWWSFDTASETQIWSWSWVTSVWCLHVFVWSRGLLPDAPVTSHISETCRFVG